MKELIVAIDLELNQPSRRVVPPSDTTSAVIFSGLRTVASTAEACGTAGFYWPDFGRNSPDLRSCACSDARVSF